MNQSFGTASIHSCLECQKLVAAHSRFAIEVLTSDGAVKGYLHVRPALCIMQWSEKNPGFNYGPVQDRLFI